MPWITFSSGVSLLPFCSVRDLRPCQQPSPGRVRIFPSFTMVYPNPSTTLPETPPPCRLPGIPVRAGLLTSTLPRKQDLPYLPRIRWNPSSSGTSCDHGGSMKQPALCTPPPETFSAASTERTPPSLKPCRRHELLQRKNSSGVTFSPSQGKDKGSVFLTSPDLKSRPRRYLPDTQHLTVSEPRRPTQGCAYPRGDAQLSPAEHRWLQKRGTTRR